MTWSLLAIVVLANRNVVAVPDWMSGVAGGAAALGPGLGALAAAASRGQRPVAVLTRHLESWRRPLRWYAVAVLGPVALLALAAAVLQVGGQRLPAASLGPGFVATSAVLLIEAFGEELGWRGELLPRLRDHLGPIPATVAAGLAWGLWHLPLFLTVNNVISHVPVMTYLVMILTGSFAFTWLHERTRSVVLTAVMHGMLNVVATPFLLRADASKISSMFASFALCTSLVAIALAATGLGRERERAVASGVRG